MIEKSLETAFELATSPFLVALLVTLVFLFGKFFGYW